MRHGTTCPNGCSQCMGAVARRVEQHGDTVYIDGLPERTIAPAPSTNGLRQAIKGGRQRALRIAPRTKS